jgi:hypothetical protein
MKKFLNISVIAALTILPFTANAAVTDAVPGPTVTGEAAAAATATTGPKYGLADANPSTDGVVATAGYVKGAYNAAIKAINKVSETANNALTANGTATLTNKTIDAEDNSISNLGTSNFKSGTVVDSTANEGNGISASATASDTKLVTEKAVAKAIEDASSDYATKTGVETTVTNAFTGATADLSGLSVSNGAVTGTATAKITVMDTWGAESVAVAPVDAVVDLTATNTQVTLTGTNTPATITAGTIAYPVQ